MPKVVGQAVARQRAYYPLASGHCRVVEPGETFDLIEGHTDGNWFVSAEPIAAPAIKPVAVPKVPAPRKKPPEPDTLA
jgi:hypothetical protein